MQKSNSPSSSQSNESNESQFLDQLGRHIPLRTPSPSHQRHRIVVPVADEKSSTATKSYQGFEEQANNSRRVSRRISFSDVSGDSLVLVLVGLPARGKKNGSKIDCKKLIGCTESYDREKLYCEKVVQLFVMAWSYGSCV